MSGGTLQTIDSKMAKIVADSLQVQCSVNPSPRELDEHHCGILAQVEAFNAPCSNISPIKIYEMVTVISWLKERKIFGVDISNKVLKILPTYLILYLCSIIKAVMKLH